jgi:hypothetical protein
MARIVTDDLVEPVVGALLGAIDIGDGGTDEQRRVLAALVAGYWERPDLELDALEPIGPEGVTVIPEGPARLRTRELIVLLELCRHPASPAQIERVDEFAAALQESGPGLDMARTLVQRGAATAMADYYRFLAESDAAILEPSLRERYAGTLDAPDEALASRLRALHDLPPGTLGHEYVEFYRRNGLTLPGDDPSMPAVFVAHDMSHVIGGYEPIGEGEIALGGMQLAMADTRAHWIAFLGNLAVHEAGIIDNEQIHAKTATLARPGAADFLAHAMARGAQCTGDFTTADHLAMVELPLDEVRARFGVPPVDHLHA